MLNIKSEEGPVMPFPQFDMKSWGACNANSSFSVSVEISPSSFPEFICKPHLVFISDNAQDKQHLYVDVPLADNTTRRHRSRMNKFKRNASKSPHSHAE
ncbi:Hypothetical predicted protein [Prunus dulcis]|nr:Hypothetical predicted protein [Prunus dulcis]